MDYSDRLENCKTAEFATKYIFGGILLRKPWRRKRRSNCVVSGGEREREGVERERKRERDRERWR